MGLAEHIIGLSAAEIGRYHYGGDAGVAEVVKHRFDAILRSGYLLARGARVKSPRGLKDHGNTFEFDHLAGDDRFIFLSAGSRYREIREPEICFGFVFDAEALVADGALVGPDLIENYEALAYEIAVEVESTLPPRPPMSNEELADFADAMGVKDPYMLQYIRSQSRRRYHDIIDGMKAKDESVPGVSEALALWCERLPTVQAKRNRGTEALEMLRGADKDLEVLVEGPLSIAKAVATIEEGEIVYRRRRW
jgi:hypothetical protein